MKSGWLWVVVGGVLEMGFMYAMKRAETDEDWWGAFLVCCILSFECLSRALKSLPLGLAYAVWTGIGAVGTVLLSAVAFGEALSLLRLVLLGALIGAMVLLKLVSHPPRQTGEAGGAGR